ncbi:hypothetical protein [Mycobacteroides abscessus]
MTSRMAFRASMGKFYAEGPTWRRDRGQRMEFWRIHSGMPTEM